MSFGFTHLIIAWLIGKAYEFFSRKKISHYTWFFLLIGGILPDADFLIDWTLGTELHRTFTHSLFFAIGMSLLIYLIFSFFKNEERKYCAIAIGAGILSHIIVDMIPGGYGVPLLWPNLTYFSSSYLGPYNPANPSFLHSSPEVLRHLLKLAIIDMALGATWLFYLWWRKKIEF